MGTAAAARPATRCYGLRAARGKHDATVASAFRPLPLPFPFPKAPSDAFDHERLEVYQAALAFFDLADELVEHLLADVAISPTS